jgi:hypothetical protein
MPEDEGDAPAILPALGNFTLLNEADMAKVKKLWSLKLANGCEISSVLFYDSALSEAVVKFTIHSAQAEDVVAEGIAEGVRAALVADEGATELEAV